MDQRGSPQKVLKKIEPKKKEKKIYQNRWYATKADLRWSL